MPVEAYLGRRLHGRLDCLVDANPPASQIVWTKNERPLNLASLQHIYVDRRGSLVFRVVSADDEGRYACAAYSSLGAGRSSTTVRVYVRGVSSHVLVVSESTRNGAVHLFVCPFVCLLVCRQSVACNVY